MFHNYDCEIWKFRLYFMSKTKDGRKFGYCQIFQYLIYQSFICFIAAELIKDFNISSFYPSYRHIINLSLFKY
jgi:hypothetical protein